MNIIVYEEFVLILELFVWTPSRVEEYIKHFECFNIDNKDEKNNLGLLMGGGVQKRYIRCEQSFNNNFAENEHTLIFVWLCSLNLASWKLIFLNSEQVDLEY